MFSEIHKIRFFFAADTYLCLRCEHYRYRNEKFLSRYISGRFLLVLDLNNGYFESYFWLKMVTKSDKNRLYPIPTVLVILSKISCWVCPWAPAASMYIAPVMQTGEITLFSSLVPEIRSLE